MCSLSGHFLEKDKILAFSGTAQILAFFALFEEDMNGNGIDDQNNDIIIDELQDILEEHVDNDNTTKLLIFPVYYNRKSSFWLSEK